MPANFGGYLAKEGWGQPTLKTNKSLFRVSDILLGRSQANGASLPKCEDVRGGCVSGGDSHCPPLTPGTTWPSVDQSDAHAKVKGFFRVSGF
jgi:hypothetical protein